MLNLIIYHKCLTSSAIFSESYEQNCELLCALYYTVNKKFPKSLFVLLKGKNRQAKVIVNSLNQYNYNKYTVYF